MHEEKLKKIKVEEAIKKYHKYNFQINNYECLSKIDDNKLKEMNKYVKMFDNLIELIKNVEGIEYIDFFLKNQKWQNMHCSISNYYYRKNKISNILWKYLFDC